MNTQTNKQTQKNRFSLDFLLAAIFLLKYFYTGWFRVESSKSIIRTTWCFKKLKKNKTQKSNENSTSNKKKFFIRKIDATFAAYHPHSHRWRTSTTHSQQTFNRFSEWVIISVYLSINCEHLYYTYIFMWHLTCMTDLKIFLIIFLFLTKIMGHCTRERIDKRK